MTSLTEKVARVSERALALGALKPTATETRTLMQDGVPWCIQLLLNFSHKAKAMNAQREKTTEKGHYHNPFLPVEKDLWVADLSPTHHVVLNKFSVLPGHSLILTKAFAEQLSPLDVADFEATASVLQAQASLVFFNGGREAGASQRHKHLQFLPLPMLGENHDPAWPLQAWFEAFDGRSERLPEFDFPHHLQKLPENVDGEALFHTYQNAMLALGLASQQALNGRELLDCAYNVLLTRDWMLVVPRSQGRFETLPINALGFAGTLLAKREADFLRYRDVGVLNILRAVVV